MTNYIQAVIRTITNAVVGPIVGWLITAGIVSQADEATFSAAAVVALTMVFTGVYYVVSTALAQRWPFLAILQGSKPGTTPKYD